MCYKKIGLKSQAPPVYEKSQPACYLMDCGPAKMGLECLNINKRSFQK